MLSNDNHKNSCMGTFKTAISFFIKTYCCSRTRVNSDNRCSRCKMVISKDQHNQKCLLCVRANFCFENFKIHNHMLVVNKSVGMFLLSKNIFMELSCYKYIHVRRAGSNNCVWLSFWFTLNNRGNKWASVIKFTHSRIWTIGISQSSEIWVTLPAASYLLITCRYLACWQDCKW